VIRITSPPPLPPRPKDGHKGLFGRVLVIGGSDGMIGAPAMAGRSALKLGAGLVEIAVPRSILAAVLTITPELIGIPFGKGVADSAEKADAIVIGPGMGQSPAVLEMLKKTVRLTTPMVVDADGLNLLAKQKKWPGYFKARAVLTPHPGEMKRLGKLIGRESVPTDDRGRIEIAVQAAKAFGQTIVLKGNRTVVADGERVYLNRTGDSSLSKAGAGDVLSGMIGTLLAQKMNQFDAACAAVYIHGRAGEMAGERLGRRCVLAHDVIESISYAVAAYEKLYG
jgi:ADP-dependent NAD(P)H-hydrate dehydratase